MTVLDASALLAFVQDETGADAVEEVLLAGAVCGVANWSEVAQKVLAADRDWDLVRSLLLSYELEVVSVTMGDAELAARRSERGAGLSLGDRLCMALADRLDMDVLTADSSWGAEGRILQLRQ